MNRLKELSAFPQLNRQPLDLRVLICELINRYPRELAEFHFDLPGELPACLDRQLIEQVFINLFNNSLEAGAGSRVIIRLSGCLLEQKLNLKISDSITGLPRQLPGQIFQARFTTKPNGMGLGLSFVRKILKMHGGQINADLSPAGGLVFSLILPAGVYDG